MKSVQMLMTGAFVVAGAALLAGCGERPPVETVQTGFRGTGMEQVYNPRLLQGVAAANQPPAVTDPADPSGPRAAEVYKNVKVLNDLSVTEFTRVMLAMAEWVVPANAPPEQQSCNYCHGADMADESKYTFKVARRMLEMTRHVNSEWQSHVGTTGVTCYTCHRGQAVPQYSWFTEPGPRENGVISTRAQQNMPARSVGLSSLPFDPFTPFLLEARSIRVAGSEPLPHGNRASIQQAEWTYGLMIHMSQSLGVNCTYCHNTQSFKDWTANATPQRATAWHGIRLARDLNVNYLTPLASTFPANRLGPLGDVAKVNCQTCHQGVYKPMFGAAVIKDYPELASATVIPASLKLGAPAAALPGDADGDGVADSKDACPDTPAGSRVGPMGCSCDLNVELTFATDSAALTPQDLRILEYAVGVLRRLNWTEGVVEGHTDSTGTDDINRPLSLQRAETVREFLLARGIEGDRMTTAGYGSSRPIADNATPEGRALNRRVVLQRTDCGLPE